MSFWRRTSDKQPRYLTFRQCPHCSYDLTTGEGQRDCHYCACPLMPEELDAHCPLCHYNFFTGEGTPACNDPADCDFALKEAPARVEALRQWVAASRPGG